jgi:hypothetical protein
MDIVVWHLTLYFVFANVYESFWINHVTFEKEHHFQILSLWLFRHGIRPNLFEVVSVGLHRSQLKRNKIIKLAASSVAG